MGFFESLFYTIWRGVAIGILISAPMGPVGILVIQRTLYKGRKTGLYTGIGAAFSDLIYCILTGFGLSFIEEFLERNQNVIQLAGSVVLIAFAIYLFKKNPASSLKTPQEEARQISPHKNILGGFLFTFSNPLILFLIIGLFARFNFSIPEISFYYYIAGYVAIFFGAVLWWEFVTFSVNKLKAHFNLRSMWLINRIIGIIILLFALVGIVTGTVNIANAETIHWNQGRGYLPFDNATPQGVLLDNKTDTIISDFYPLPNLSDSLSLTFRSKNIQGLPDNKVRLLSVARPSWGFCITGLNDTLTVSIKGGEKTDGVESDPCLEVSVRSLADKSEKRVTLSEGFNPFDGDNLWQLDVEDGNLILAGGDRGFIPILEHEAPTPISGFGFYSTPGDKVLISDITLDFSRKNRGKKIILSDLRNQLNESDDPLEGYWMVFDRELEESLLKLGGNYKLACKKENNHYKMVYLDGATVNAENWRPGDAKAILNPTPFPGIYDVVWIDSMKAPLSHEVRAQQGEGNTLLIQFPYHSSKLRLRKLPE